MLVSDLIDRCYSQWLYPAGINRPAFDTLASGIDDTTLTIPLAGRVQNVPKDSILEVGSELILSSSVGGSTVTAFARGWLDTDAASHSSGAQVLVDPKYPRKVVFESIKTLLGDLYSQGVYQFKTDTATTYTRSGPRSLPSGGLHVLGILVDVNTGGAYAKYRRLRAGVDYIELSEFTPTKYQLRTGGGESNDMVVTYAAAIGTPAAEGDSLDTLGVSTSFQPHLALGVAGYLLQSRELPRVQIDEVKRALTVQGINVGNAMNVGQSMLQQYMRYVQAERVRLDEQRATDYEVVR